MREAGQGARDIQGLPVKRGNGARRRPAVVHKRSLLSGVATNFASFALLLLLFPTKRRVPRSAFREPFVIRKPNGFIRHTCKKQAPNALENQHLAQGGCQRGCLPLMAFGFFSP